MTLAIVLGSDEGAGEDEGTLDARPARPACQCPAHDGCGQAGHDGVDAFGERSCLDGALGHILGRDLMPLLLDLQGGVELTHLPNVEEVLLP